MKADKEPEISEEHDAEARDSDTPNPASQEGEETVEVKPVKNEKDILDLIKQENSWEQVLYQVVALESMDPWNLDINLLARGFADYVSVVKELDFRIPAKWVIIASILLRMKSDYIKILKMDEEAGEGDEFMDLEELEEMAELEEAESELEADVGPIEAVPKRKPIRRVTITELVDSLKKVVQTENRREVKLQQRRNKINISNEDITRRIDNLYKKIGNMLTIIKENEIKFSKLVGRWKRGKVVDTFLPLVHLDHEKKVACRQDKIFKEIFIKKRVERGRARAG
jgi:segregation and condensation protein A